MDKRGNIMSNGERPVENIVHRTDTRPFSLHRTCLAPGESCALYLHCHPEAELFYLEKGSLCFYVENRSFHLEAGEGIFIPPNLIHNAVNRSAESVSCCYRAAVFSADMLEKTLPSYCQPYFRSLRTARMDCIYPIFARRPENAALLSLLPSLFHLQGDSLSQWELSFTGLLMLCWQELYNLCFSHVETPSSHRALGAELQNCLDYMQAHFAEPLTLAEFAASAGLSESYFCHSFKKFTGYTPFAYLNRIRIVKSCELLQDSGKKITDIALLCGFNNISYFNRTFYKVMKMTPSAYRKGPV